MYSEGEQMMLDEWLGVVSQLWDAVGKDPDEKRLTVYARQLSMIPLGLLERSVDRAIRENGKYQTVPTIGAIWAAVRKELGDPVDLDTAIQAWIERQFDKCIVRFGSGNGH